MNQNTGETSKLPGEGSCSAMNLPAHSGEELDAGIRHPGTDSDTIKLLLNEFRALHEQRLGCLEMDTTATEAELVQKKVNFLWSYVHDLTDQNQVLLQTIEDLQKEADYKGSSMKLRTSDRILDVSEVNLRTLLLDELVGPATHVSLSPGSLVQITSEFQDLKIQLQTKNKVLSDLEKELTESFQHKQKTAAQVLESSERLVHLQSELSCLQRIQRDNMKEIAEKNMCITKLQANVELLRQEGADTHAQLSKLNVRAKELQEELKRKEGEWRQREDEWRLYEKEEKKREEQWKREVEEERGAHAQWAEKVATLNSELTVSRKQVERQKRKLSESHQREETLLSQAEGKMVSLRGELDALFERRLEEKEARIRQLTGELNGVRQKLQTSEFMLSDISETLDQTRTSLDTERQQRQQIQDQLHHANKEMEHLQQELTRARHTTEKKIQRRDIKLCTLGKELTESRKQHSECQKELLQREKALEKLSEEKDELRAKMEDRSREFVHLNQTKERLEAELALSHEKLHTSHLEVRSRDQLILQLRAEMKTAEQKHQRKHEQFAALEGEVRHLKHQVRGHQEKVRDIQCLVEQKEKEQQQLCDQLCIGQQQVETFEGKLKKQEAEMEVLYQRLKGAKEELKDASLQAQEQKETAAIFRQKYTAAIEKVHRVQGQVEHLEEELQYAQQQLSESQLATHSVNEELAEMERRYQEKVSQWENSQDALDQLTDELQASQNLLKESQQREDHLKNLMGSLQEQADTLKQQKLMLECDLQLYQQSHSHSDEEYLSLLSHRQQLQKCCTKQVERLAECEKAILQMKSELERQAQEKVCLKQSLAASRHTHMSNRRLLEQEVIRLKKEVTRLELELADTQKVHIVLLRQSAEELKEARQEAASRCSEVDVQRGEVRRLQEELLKGEEKTRCAIRERQSLSGRVTQLSQELEELRCKLQVAVEELAARAEEARRMEECLNEGKLAEGKIRSMAVKLETEVAELRRNLQQAVDHKVKAEREKQDAQDQVEMLRSELARTRSDNDNLRHESQLVMSNVNRWITEQKVSSESLTSQMKTQNKVLLIITEEKKHLQDANDTLKAEVKRLKEVVDEKEREMKHFKARIREQGILRQDKQTMEKQGCVALNLSKIEDMQTRLRSNMEAIRTLNQQLNSLSRENKELRRQLAEERSMGREVERLLPPPPTQWCSTVHLLHSLNDHKAPPSTSLPSSLRLPHPLRLDAVTGSTDGTLTQTKVSGAGPGRPGESKALDEAFWIRPTASLEDAWSGRTSRDLNK